MNKLSIDFDSCVTNIYKIGNGLVLSEPTVASVADDNKNEVKAIGVEAKKLIGKTTKNTKIVFPVFEGEIVNEKVATGILQGFLGKIDSLYSNQAIFAVPCGYTEDMVEKYKKVAKNSGISKVYFAEVPILSALGQRIALNDSNPYFIIDMAGGTTNIAALSLDGIITGISVNFGGNKVSTDIIDYIADNYGMQIGLLTAEKLRNEIASLEDDDGLSTIINGRDVNTGSPKALSIRAIDIIKPIKQYYDKIAEITIAVLKKLQPEVSAEIRHSGVYVSGLAANVYGLQQYYTSKFKIPVKIADNAPYAVALGGGVVMGDPDLLKRIAVLYK